MGCYLVMWLMGDFLRGWIVVVVWGLIFVLVWVIVGWFELFCVKRVSSIV